MALSLYTVAFCCIRKISKSCSYQGASTAEKLRGDQGLAGLGVGCGRGSPPPAVRVRGYQPRKIFENSDAKSCILATTCCEISCFLKTIRPRSWGTKIHCWFPLPKSWRRPVSPGPYGCCAYASNEVSRRFNTR